MKKFILDKIISKLFQTIPGMTKPMVISIWCGRGKPILNDFLKPFVTELNEILRDGIKINSFDLNVSILFFVCDSPARAFLKGDKATIYILRMNEIIE